MHTPMHPPTTLPAAARRPPHPALRIGIAAAVAVVLVLGLVGGLQRAGALPWAAATHAAALAHGALMISAWLGSVIAIERAVALRTALARSVPAFSLLGGGALIAGLTPLAGGLLSLASALSLSVHVELWRRQREPHHAAMCAGAACWLAGNLSWWSGLSGATGAPVAWFAFLVLTIAAERLELTRLTRRTAAAQRLFGALAAALFALALAAAAGWGAAAQAFGAALLALALWLARWDIARFTIRQQGLPRYIALALWCGYLWLAVSGAAWLAGSRDAALHALGVGFVLSMIMAHAPVILPAVAGLRVAYTPLLVLPLALLQLSVALRLALDLRIGAWLHLLALVGFVLTLARGVHAAARTR